MASSANKGLLSIGAFLVILVVSILLGAFAVGWWMVLPLVIALSGAWILVLAGMQASNPQKYERSSFSLAGWGCLLIAVGGAWFVYGYGWIYSLAVILLTLGAVAIIAAVTKK